MSLSEDYIGDGLFDHDFPHGVENDEWTTRDGRLLKLRDMTDRYIENVMRMIGEDDDFYGACSAELSRRANTEATTDDRPADTPGCTCNGYIDACKRADRYERLAAKATRKLCHMCRRCYVPECEECEIRRIKKREGWRA